jgi:hypothetical protein
MNLSEFALAIVNDPGYRASVVTRAASGNLPVEIEMLLLEMADGRQPISVSRAAPVQSRALAFVRPSVRPEEVQP